MAIEQDLNTIFQEGETREKIAKELLTAKDKEFKTEIKNVLTFTALDTIGQYFEDRGLKFSSKAIKLWCSWYRTNAISFNRKSRTELVEALKALATIEEQRQRTMREKMIGGRM